MPQNAGNNLPGYTVSYGRRPKYALSHYPHIYASVFQAVHFLNAFGIKTFMLFSFSRPCYIPRLVHLPLSACRINI